MFTARSLPPRTALFLPASNPRAVTKARTLAADMVILDLEDAVREDMKDEARAAAVAAAGEGLGDAIVAIRVNAAGTQWHEADVAAVRNSAAAVVVVPKVEEVEGLHRLSTLLGKPVLAMIETPRGVLAAPQIAALAGVAGLIAGTNDLRAELGIPAGAARSNLSLALQTIVLAARFGGTWALDGVFNALDDADGLARECREGRAMGYDGKTLIHPNQLAIAAEAFGPSEAEIADAHALVAAATGGAERFDGRMIEAMHVAQARALLDRLAKG